jgi:hypothetical protein
MYFHLNITSSTFVASILAHQYDANLEPDVLRRSPNLGKNLAYFARRSAQASSQAGQEFIKLFSFTTEKPLRKALAVLACAFARKPGWFSFLRTQTAKVRALIDAGAWLAPEDE